MLGEEILVMSRSAARCLREMVSLTHSFVAIIYDSTELREVQDLSEGFPGEMASAL